MDQPTKSVDQADSLGEAWQLARLHAGLSQVDMAARIGICESYLSLIENNRRTPSIDQLKCICRVVGLSMERLSPDPEVGDDSEE